MGGSRRDEHRYVNDAVEVDGIVAKAAVGRDFGGSVTGHHSSRIVLFTDADEPVADAAVVAAEDADEVAIDEPGIDRTNDGIHLTA